MLETGLLLNRLVLPSSISLHKATPQQSELIKTFLAKTAKETLLLTESIDEIKQKNLRDEDSIQALYFDNQGTYLALYDGTNIIGTGALKRINSETAELKRLFIAPAYRNKKLGFHLVQALFLFALQTNYKKIRLEVCKPEIQTQAVSFYSKLGFKEIPPYNQTNAGLYLEITFSYDHADPYFRHMITEILANCLVTTTHPPFSVSKSESGSIIYEFDSPRNLENINMRVVEINKSFFYSTTSPEYSYVVLGGTGHLECKLGNRDLTVGTIIHSYEEEVLSFSECKNLVLGIVKFNNLKK